MTSTSTTAKRRFSFRRKAASPLADGHHKKTFWQRVYRDRYLLLLFLPCLIYYILFKYVPMYGIQLAFKEFDMVAGISASPWVGWSNFELLFRDREFFLALKNTLIISYMQLLLFFPFPVILAILLNEVKIQRFKKSVELLLKRGLKLKIFRLFCVADGLLSGEREKQPEREKNGEMFHVQ